MPSQSASFYLWDLIPNPDPGKSDMRYLKGNPDSGLGQGGLGGLNVEGLPLDEAAVRPHIGDSTWIAATSSGRLPTARRPTTCATTRSSKG